MRQKKGNRMDQLEQRLKDDAADIRADVSPALSSRIAASLRATERAPEKEARSAPAILRWWISSLTGMAAVLVAIVLLNRNDPALPDLPVDAPIVATVPQEGGVPQAEFPLRAESAMLTDTLEPLEEELENLKSDLEKARRNVEEELRQSF